MISFYFYPNDDQSALCLYLTTLFLFMSRNWLSPRSLSPRLQDFMQTSVWFVPHKLHPRPRPRQLRLFPLRSVQRRRRQQQADWLRTSWPDSGITGLSRPCAPSLLLCLWLWVTHYAINGRRFRSPLLFWPRWKSLFQSVVLWVCVCVCDAFIWSSLQW